MLFSLLYMVLRAALRSAPAGDQRDREVEIGTDSMASALVILR